METAVAGAAMDAAKKEALKIKVGRVSFFILNYFISSLQYFRATLLSVTSLSSLFSIFTSIFPCHSSR